MNGESPAPPSAPNIEGWDVRFIGDEPRLSEVVKLYRELGFEVMVKDFQPELCSGCTACFDETLGKPVKVVYVREAGEG